MTSVCVTFLMNYDFDSKPFQMKAANTQRNLVSVAYFTNLL